MSLSTPCPTCPFEYGFDIKNNELLTVCSDPSQRCLNFKGKLIDQIANWVRFSSVGEKAKSGILELSDLTPGDYVRILSSIPGRSYGEKVDRSFTFCVSEFNDGKLIGTVDQDTYLEDGDLEHKRYAMQSGQEVVIYGAVEVAEDQNGPKCLKWFDGQIHCGRFVTYGHMGSNDFDWGLYVQEVQLLDPEDTLAFNVFSTDPNNHRSAPII